MSQDDSDTLYYICKIFVWLQLATREESRRFRMCGGIYAFGLIADEKEAEAAAAAHDDLATGARNVAIVFETADGVDCFRDSRDDRGIGVKLTIGTDRKDDCAFECETGSTHEIATHALIKCILSSTESSSYST
jgi:hypothetical protein